MKNKKAIFGMSFNWIFAILAGGFILVIAIYGASKFIQTSETNLNTQTAARLTSLLDPLETGLASGKATEINFQKQSRFYFTCNDKAFPPFGRQTIAFSEQTFGEKFSEKSEKVNIKDKYVFTNDLLEGKSLTIFSKPFELTFKVADLTMIISDNYCFYQAPEDVEDDLESLNLKNIIFMNNTKEKCNSIKVCFTSEQKDCQIKVNPDENYLIKNNKKLYFTDNLIYAAIFSSPEIYECNVKRLKSKFNELSKIYLTKIKVMERKGCTSNIGAKLELMNTPVESSRNLLELYNKAEEINQINKAANSGCKLY
jgi:hypothetical protein